MAVLKIIGFVILFIFLFLLFIVLLLLFVPIRYKLEVTKKEEKINAVFSAFWMLHILEYNLSYLNKSLSQGFRVFFIRVDLDKKKAETVEEKEDSEHMDNPKKDVEQNEQNQKKHSSKKKENEKGISLLKRIKNLVNNREALKKLYFRDETIIKTAFKRVKHIIKHLLPRVINGQILFGMEDPADTGEILGAVCAVYGFTGELVKIVPDFQNKVFEPDVHIKGRVRIFTVARLLLLLYFNKGLRKTLRHLKRISETS